MSDLHSVLGDNLTEQRHLSGYTQKQVAEKLSYSDKAVSKWERGASVPDITVLKKLAELYGVSVDDLLTRRRGKTDEEIRLDKIRYRNYALICGMSVLLVWLIATVLFVLFRYLFPQNPWHFMCFIYAFPVSCVVWLVLNSVWLNRRLNYLIISILLWAVLLAVFMTFVPLGLRLWFIFALGIPGQLIILLWSRIRKNPEKDSDTNNT